MFLFWKLIAILIGIEEEAKDSYDAYQYKKQGGIETKYPAIFSKKK